MARKFRFRLEVVQRLREQERDAQRRVVASKALEVTNIQRQIASLRSDLESSQRLDRTQRGERLLNVASLRTENVRRSWIKASTGRVNERLAVIRNELSHEQGQMTKTMTHLRVVEKLRERQWTRHRAELAREQQAAGDEAALELHRRKHGTGNRVTP